MTNNDEMTVQPPTRKMRVLVVEDDAAMRDTLVRILALTGRYVMLQAENGQAALTLMHQTMPDLVMSDINMPIMDGLAFYKALRKNPAWVSIPFIFLTAKDAPEDIRAGRALGAEDYLTKPIDDVDLINIVDARLFRSAELRLAQVEQAYLDTVNVLANTIEGRDPYTYGHVERVSLYARWTALELGWTSDQLRILEFGARLHDIGKIIVPDSVLKKDTPLTDDEWRIMKQHPEAGAKILYGIQHLRRVVPYVLYHHERWDGTGYPYGLKGNKIPIQGRLLALADVFDALTSDRPYRPGRSVDEALAYIQEKAGTEFDPILSRAFVTAIYKHHKAQTRPLGGG